MGNETFLLVEGQFIARAGGPNPADATVPVKIHTADAHGTTAAAAVTDNQATALRVGYESKNTLVSNAYLVFDTSALPINANILNASLVFTSSQTDVLTAPPSLKILPMATGSIYARGDIKDYIPQDLAMRCYLEGDTSLLPQGGGTIETIQEGAQNSTQLINCVDGTTHHWQALRAMDVGDITSMSGLISSAWFHLRRIGSYPEATCWAEIWSTTGVEGEFRPDALLAISDTVPWNDISTSGLGGWQEFIFSPSAANGGEGTAQNIPYSFYQQHDPPVWMMRVNQSFEPRQLAGSWPAVYLQTYWGATHNRFPWTATTSDAMSDRLSDKTLSGLSTLVDLPAAGIAQIDDELIKYEAYGWSGVNTIGSSTSWIVVALGVSQRFEIGTTLTFGPLDMSPVWNPDLAVWEDHPEDGTTITRTVASHATSGGNELIYITEYLPGSVRSGTPLSNGRPDFELIERAVGNSIVATHSLGATFTINFPHSYNAMREGTTNSFSRTFYPLASDISDLPTPLGQTAFTAPALVVDQSYKWGDTPERDFYTDHVSDAVQWSVSQADYRGQIGIKIEGQDDGSSTSFGNHRLLSSGNHASHPPPKLLVNFFVGGNIETGDEEEAVTLGRGVGAKLSIDGEVDADIQTSNVISFGLGIR